MDDKQKNTYWYKFFLMCNKMANDILNMKYQNFAKLIVEANNGRFGNEQMTRIYETIEESLSELVGNDPEFIWDELELEEIAEIPVETLEADYSKYCDGYLILDFTKPENLL